MRILFVSRPSLYKQKGGDTLHIEETAKALRKLGHVVDIATNEWKHPKKYDLLHFFNLGQPAVFLPYIKQAQGKSILLSSIFVDYREVDQNVSFIKRLIIRFTGDYGLEYFKTIARYFKGQEPWPGLSYIFQGHRWAIQKVLEHTKLLITASHYEADMITKSFKFDRQRDVIHVGCDHMVSDVQAPEILRRGVLCVARFEPLKNQLGLIRACNTAHIRLKLAGKASRNHKRYFKVCKKLAGRDVEFLGYLKSQDVYERMHEAKVHALISHFETTGLSTLEAFNNGCQVVVADHPIQRELFGDHAFYASIKDENQLIETLQKALDSKEEHTQWVREKFSWRKAAERLDIYYTQLNTLVQ